MEGADEQASGTVDGPTQMWARAEAPLSPTQPWSQSGQ